MSDTPVDTEFREGEEVVLAEGTYQGTQGVFVRLREDALWADVTERDGSVRSHPVAWLKHAGAAMRAPEVEAWEGEGGAAHAGPAEPAATSNGLTGKSVGAAAAERASGE